MYANINLPSVWVYRSPQRNKYCRGPILAYWPRISYRRMNSSSSEYKQSINQPVLFPLARGRDEQLFKVSQLKEPNQSFQPLRESVHASILPLAERATTRRSSRLADTLEISAVCNLQSCPTPKDTPVADGSPVRPHILLTLYRVRPRGSASILTRDKLRDERWRRDSVRGE